MSEHLLPIPDHIMAHAELGLEGIEAMMRRARAALSSWEAAQ